MKTTQFILILALALAPVIASAATAKEKAIRELFTLQKTDRIGDQVINQVVEGLKPQVPENKQSKLAEVAKKEMKVGDLIDKLVPIYDSNFSEAEVNDIIAFYKTTSGQKYIALQPKLIGESTAQIQSWGTKYADRVREKMGIKK